MMALDQSVVPTTSVDFSSYSMPSTTYEEVPAYRRQSSFFLDPAMMLHQGLRGDDRRDNRRNFHRKVRTGCATCKARHVKCDEAKPECKRCTSTGRECSGYEEPKKDRKAATLLPGPTKDTKDGDGLSTRSRSTSVDAESTTSYARTVATSTATAQSLVASVGRPPLSNFVTSDPKEKHYLSMFLSETFPSIWRVEIPHPERWMPMVSQLIWEEPVVRHSAIALAAAHERQRLVVMRVRDDPSRFAMEYYNKAIRQLLRTPPKDETQQTRSTIALLTCCLMFVAIEMFLNHDGAIRTHLRSGVRILKTAHFAPFASEEEELLVANFEAFDSHALMYPGAGASQYEAETEGPISEERQGPQRPSLVLETEFLEPDDAVRAYNQLCTRINRFRHALATDIPPPECELIAQQTELLTGLSRWQQAYNCSCASWVGLPAHNASVLAMSVTAHTLFVRGALDPTCMAYDAFTEDVEALVPRLRAVILARDPAATRFSVDTLANELVCIWILCLITRAPSVRTQLRELLMMALSRRGVWCGMALTVVTDRIRAIEEAGNAAENPEDIPSYNRVRWVGIDVDSDSHTVSIVFRRVGGEGVEHESLPLWH